MDTDISLSGLDPESARDYVLQHIIALKNTQKERQQLAEDIKLWSGRAELAAAHGREELRNEALLRCQEISAKDDILSAEEQKLVADIAEMKRQLSILKRQPTPTVDADLLLAQLEQVVGEKDLSEARFRDAEADVALEELKRKLDTEKHE